ncbi:uncharacterized protein LTHEOB_7692 [Lasiodiplodia theobromae]|uniref:uncharacterized protein n=1 Tax=Lasiodiplodia theobromae TaxID=45133 RepID=UPI0015C32305|nr:uncharacterized protein LTHEOB_7692 [Lasiodiplodia theobromae]KAF4542500.1 hypothetical protein LTHEOB_7692 [Lasiodiplodia theobromae]
MLLNSKLMLAQAAVAFAAPRTQNQWAPCEIPGQTMPVVCGGYRVPLDYLAPNSSETIELRLYKVAATKQPSQGTILFNFGGPGLPGGPFLAKRADQLLRYTGGSFDLVTLDPRGTTPYTLPFSCFATPKDYKDWNSANTAWPWNSSDTTLGENWAITKVYTGICANNTNITTSGGYIGTAYTARDYMSVATVLGEDGLLRYWGTSYGAVLGATIAAMFPDRIDRMILDAVMNIHEYWHSQDVETLTDADKAFSKFLEECFDAGEEKFFDDPYGGAEAYYAIYCADKMMRTDRIEDVMPFLEKMVQLSRIKGDVAEDVMICSQWPVESKERYLGDYNVQTKHPLLIIGNTYDAVTPFVSAKNASESFPGSALLEHGGFGHGSSAQTSVCTTKAIHDYFVSGKLPEPGTVCEPDLPFFDLDVKWSDVIPEDLS